VDAGGHRRVVLEAEQPSELAVGVARRSLGRLDVQVAATRIATALNVPRLTIDSTFRRTRARPEP